MILPWLFKKRVSKTYLLVYSDKWFGIALCYFKEVKHGRPHPLKKVARYSQECER